MQSIPNRHLYIQSQQQKHLAMYVKYVPRQQFMPTLYIKIPGIFVLL